jgi:hypothetical protein
MNSLPPLPPMIVSPGVPPMVSLPPLPPRIVSPGPPQNGFGAGSAAQDRLVSEMAV